MKAAVVQAAGKAPVYADFKEPEASGDAVLVSVAASSLSHITRGRASGNHYSASGRYPLVPGLDGTGRLADGSRVYFALPEPPYGGMAQRTLVSAARCVPLPDGLDFVSAAALAIPGASSWIAYRERAKLLPGEAVLVNGATGASGLLAVQLAKHLGASRVVATGRNPAALERLKGLGADVVLPLTQDKEKLERAFQEQFALGVDVVVDYLWGESTELLLASAARASKDAVPVRFAQVGSMGGQDITLPAAALRSSAIVLMGSGIGSVLFDRYIEAARSLFQIALPAHLRIDTVAVPLAEVEQAWTREGRERLVFTV